MLHKRRCGFSETQTFNTNQYQYKLALAFEKLYRALGSYLSRHIVKTPKETMYRISHIVQFFEKEMTAILLFLELRWILFIYRSKYYSLKKIWTGISKVSNIIKTCAVSFYLSYNICWRTTSADVLQSGVLLPLFFTIFVNSITNQLLFSYHLQSSSLVCKFGDLI